MRAHKTKLTVQLVATMGLVVMGTVLLCCFLNQTFLLKYYMNHKEKELLSGFEVIRVADSKEKLRDDSFDVTFEKICNNGNMDIIVIDSDWTIVRSSTTSIHELQLQLYDIVFGMDGKELETVKSKENYVIAKQIDERLDAEYLILWGTLSDGGYIYMKTALESIRESASITNSFFMRIGLGACLLSMFVIVLFAKNISRPIRQLSEISKRMSELHFEAKYQTKETGSEEIEELGHNMNELSQALESAISELKTANIQLQQDIQKKEAIDEMRKEFLSNVSHELKTPLALIQGYAEGLREGIDEDEESRNFYCDVIVDEADKMNLMVKKLLTLNQLEFGNEILEMSRFDITELIRGVIQASSLLLSQEMITLEFDELSSVYVWGDEFKIEEVITNYLSNAIHYALGEKKIKLFYTYREELLRISVFNTGKQIAEEDLDKVWDKFYKVDKARTREYGGNGIGLSIVKAIMDSHHQSCGIKNHENGVEFWFELERYR